MLGADRVGHARRHGLGKTWIETGFILAEDPPTLRGPDIAFIAAGRLPPREGRGRFVTTIPDLVVEILSPHERAEEVREKVSEYLVAGVRLVWVVDPATRTVALHRSGEDVRVLAEGDALDGEDVLPGFRVAVDVVFEI